MDERSDMIVSIFFKALGNPTRLKIIRALTLSEKCVGEVEYGVSASQASVSQHLAILKESGIVRCQKKGTLRCYSLVKPELIKGLLAMVEKDAATTFEELSSQ